jgi:hypothetical protein
VTLLDEVLPQWHEHERHGVHAAAPAGRLVTAALQVTPADAPLLRTLFALRGLPAGPHAPVWEQLIGGGFFLLGERPGREIVAGAVGRPWRVWEHLRRDVDFAAFAEPGYVKMAMGFLARDGELVTETRILATDGAARRAFAPYWLVVKPASGITRRSWLAAAARRAVA